eukprot:CAMPEP_0204641738 /NCGR_PEP_ID=MMETSP0717-20131115/51305_1 /ASSEMBLY_ACC=CAM_ASM_000666 /TAXON_ID=230516 /ORGANISM="Chaetoceros curvisetus" /LENGTH=281 /DNA_ID=CAMNT_0051662441 /DNA_START=32 /DNA_END=877 /DNA_ORIENTATION=+
MNNNDGRRPRQMEDTNGFQTWYDQLPFVTKNWLTAAVLFTVMVNFEVIPIRSIYWSFEKVKDEFEIWRILSNFLFMGTFSFNTLISLFMLYQYSMNYESQSGFNTGSGGGTADYVFMLIFGMMGLLITGSFIDVGVFFGEQLKDYVMYLWCKRDPAARVSLFGFPLQAMYLPFAHMGLRIFMGGSIATMVHAFVVAHVYYFLAEVVPKMHAKVILNTPEFLVSMFGVGEYISPRPENGMQGFGGGGGGWNRPGPNAPPANAGGNNNQGGYDWGGGGQRLGR